MILYVIIGVLLLFIDAQADTLPQGYVVSTGVTIWNAGGSGSNNGLTSTSTSTTGTASCGTLSTVTRAQIDESSFVGSAMADLPGSGSYIRASMSGGASGGNCSIDIDITDMAPGNGLIGQLFFFQKGYNDNTNGLTLKLQTAGGAARLVLDANSSTSYVRRQEGWNMLQGYCSTSPTFPDWYVQSGAPTCSTTFVVYTIQATIAAGTTITMYFGDLVRNYYARPQITVWSADGDNTAKTVMEPYMTARGLVGSYAPTSGEINQGANPMSLANLLALSSAGWSIHPHQSTSSVGDYSALSASALSNELRLVKNQFTVNAIPMSKFYYPPGGVCTLAVHDAMISNGFSGMGCSGNVSADQNGRPIYGGLLSWNGMWNVSAESVNLAGNIALIEHAIKYGEQLSLLWHKVDGTVTCNVACFHGVIDYLYIKQQAGQVDVVTWDQLMLRQKQPRIKR